MINCKNISKKQDFKYSTLTKVKIFVKKYDIGPYPAL